MKYINYAQTILKQAGYRVTKPRLLVLDMLNASVVPQNAYDITAKALSNGRKIDVSTVYRILEVYRKLGLAHFIHNSQKYSPCLDFICEESKHCHHQFICKKCKQAQELHFEDVSFLNQLKNEFKDLLIDRHYLEFSGLCQSCKK